MIKVRAPKVEGAIKERIVLNDTIGEKPILIRANGGTHEVDETHPRIKELLRKGELVEIVAKAAPDAK